MGVLAACAMPSEDEDYSVVESEVSVGTYATSSCSTAVVIGLSKQIAEEVGCMSPGGLVKFEAGGNLKITSNAVLPYLHSSGKTDLEKVAATRLVQVNSAFRTVAQQYLLYRWFQLGRCGIPAAATPGRSNHEGGRALDIANYSSLIGAMAARGWSHNVPGDPVHFEHLSSPDQRGRDVRAFQRLWNRNHPNDLLVEDGAYGPATEARLRNAPATGFPIGAGCTQKAGAEVVMVQGPDKLAPGARVTYKITVENSGQLAWPATTKIITADGQPSELYDAMTWTSAKEVGAIGSEVAVGAKATIEIPVHAPQVTEVTPVYTQFALATAGMRFGKIDLAATVTPNGDEDTSGDADDGHDPEADGACNSGGGASWAALLVPALVLVRRRRARR
ncbi:MAG: NBR1-Ig-like domain-containing protein [Myxococcota bacterium]|nr:NBR1-Ig-like domain-containing protein [Myxococcota bacterium]